MSKMKISSEAFASLRLRRGVVSKKSNTIYERLRGNE
jgi:hypothetical protein